MLEARENLNQEILKAKQLLNKNPMVIMRDKYTNKPLGVSFTEDGLRSIANKNGVYLYCKGRVNNLNDALKSEKNPNIIVERFIPKEYPNNRSLTTAEILWINKAKHMIGN